MAYYRRKRQETGLTELVVAAIMMFGLIAFSDDIGKWAASQMVSGLQPAIEQTANPQR